jgi:protein-S-isoprenylcysteine O-methyltransferase Ste14
VIAILAGVTDVTQTSPGVRVPPPLLYLAGFLAGAALEAVAETPAPPLPLAIAIAASGVVVWAVLDGAAMREFRRAGTEVAPSRSATALVTTGPYRWSRNPMYVGMAVLYAALAVAFGVLWALVTLAGVLLVIRWSVIAREERYLDRAFGEGYREYRSRVRRWI